MDGEPIWVPFWDNFHTISARRERMQALLDDCRELERKKMLTVEKRKQWEMQLTSTSTNASVLEEIQWQVRQLYLKELDDIIFRVRHQQNESLQKKETYETSDLVAVAAGGVLGALNAWMRQPAATTKTTTDAVVTASKPSTSSIWASAFEAAQASLNVSVQRRHVEHLQLQHLSGVEATSDHVLLCINGFMTQDTDPAIYWAPWWATTNTISPSTVVVYAVQWEAGDAAVWSEFCQHANEKLQTTAGSSATALLEHFTGNPWHKAQDKAEQVGVVLARVLAAHPTLFRGRKISLFGHSLGGAVIYSVFQELARLRNSASQPIQHPVITNAVCFAGAFLPTPTGLQHIAQELPPDGRFLNVYSTHDSVLSKLLRALHLHTGDVVAAGCAAIAFQLAQNDDKVDNRLNIDVSDLIPPRLANHFGHSYGPHMTALVTRIKPHLVSLYAVDK